MNDSKLPGVVSLVSKEKKKQRCEVTITYLDGSIDVIVCDMLGAAIESPGMLALVNVQPDGSEDVIALLNTECLKKAIVSKIYE